MAAERHGKNGRSWAEGIVDAIAEVTEYRLNKRQVRALDTIEQAHLRIRSHAEQNNTVAEIRDALGEFLRGAKLRQPFNVSVAGLAEPVGSALVAYHSADAWANAIEAGDAGARRGTTPTAWASLCPMSNTVV